MSLSSSMAWRKKNPERWAEVQREYRRKRIAQNPDWARERLKEWRKKNPEKVSAALKRYAKKNPEKISTLKRAWAKENPEASRIKCARRRAAQKASPENSFTRSDWSDLLMAFGNACFYCGVSGRLTIDHVQPLSKGGAHARHNIVPACKSCNSKKSAMDVQEFMSRTVGSA